LLEPNFRSKLSSNQDHVVHLAGEPTCARSVLTFNLGKHLEVIKTITFVKSGSNMIA